MAIFNLLGLTSATFGGLLLAYALTLKPTSYRLIKARDGSVAICLDDKKVVAGYGGPLVVSDEPCPDMVGNGPTPQIEANRPAFAPWGLGLIIIGFALQIPAAIQSIVNP